MVSTPGDFTSFNAVLRGRAAPTVLLDGGVRHSLTYEHCHLICRPLPRRTSFWARRRCVRPEQEGVGKAEVEAVGNVSAASESPRATVPAIRLPPLALLFHFGLNVSVRCSHQLAPRARRRGASVAGKLPRLWRLRHGPRYASAVHLRGAGVPEEASNGSAFAGAEATIPPLRSGLMGKTF